MLPSQKHFGRSFGPTSAFWETPPPSDPQQMVDVAGSTANGLQITRDQTPVPAYGISGDVGFHGAAHHSHAYRLRQPVSLGDSLPHRRPLGFDGTQNSTYGSFYNNERVNLQTTCMNGILGASTSRLGDTYQREAVRTRYSKPPPLETVTPK